MPKKTREHKLTLKDRVRDVVQSIFAIPMLALMFIDSMINNREKREKAKMREKEEKQMALQQHEAVCQILIPSLSGEAQTTAQALVDKHGADVIHAALHATENIIIRVVWLRKESTVKMRVDGSVLIDEKLEIAPDTIAEEIARYTDLWENESADDEDLQPSADAVSLVSWIPQALLQQPRLLSCFVSAGLSGAWIVLNPVYREDRIDDERTRWSIKYWSTK